MMSKVICGGEGCIGWMTNIVVIGGERYKYESTSGGVRVKNILVFKNFSIKKLIIYLYIWYYFCLLCINFKEKISSFCPPFPEKMSSFPPS